MDSTIKRSVSVGGFVLVGIPASLSGDGGESESSCSVFAIENCDRNIVSKLREASSAVRGAETSFDYQRLRRARSPCFFFFEPIEDSEALYPQSLTSKRGY